MHCLYCFQLWSTSSLIVVSFHSDVLNSSITEKHNGGTNTYVSPGQSLPLLLLAPMCQFLPDLSLSLWQLESQFFQSHMASQVITPSVSMVAQLKIPTPQSQTIKGLTTNQPSVYSHPESKNVSTPCVSAVITHGLPKFSCKL